MIKGDTMQILSKSACSDPKPFVTPQDFKCGLLRQHYNCPTYNKLVA